MKEMGQYPVDASLEAISTSLRENSTCLIKAEPGAGKTTRVPIHLLASVKGEILVLEPRRLAARLAAERSAWFLDEPCGKTVGFRIRQEHKLSRDTRLTFITEGLFVRLLRNNSTLKNIGAVILDEFHERNIHTDMALALVRQLQLKKRPDLKLVVMSATLDTAALEKYLEDAKVFDIEGRNFPVEVEYMPDNDMGGRLPKYWEKTAASAVKKILKDPRCPGHILVFLTGLGEIMMLKRQLEMELRDAGGKETSILPLAADLPVKEQRKIFAEGRDRKIVLSTNVAETSVTIPGITGVIDLGLAKIPAHAPWSGMPTLEIKRISQASAIQRGGRAGRTQSGVVYRLYSKGDFINRDKFTPPDIQRIDISHTILEVMNLGYTQELMPWFEAPDEKNLESAFQLLRFLGAISEDGDLTAFGKKLSLLPVHPRLAAIAMEGAEAGCPEDALMAACLIGEKFALKRGMLDIDDDEEGEPCDVAMQLDLLKASIHRKSGISEHPFQLLDSRRKQRVLSLYQSMARICKFRAAPPPKKTDWKKLTRCLLRGYPDRVARLRDVASKKKRKGSPPLYTFCLGRGGLVDKASVVHKEKPQFLIAIDAVENLKVDAAKGVIIRACSTLPQEILESDPGGLLRGENREEFEQKSGKVTLWKDLFYGKLRVESKRMGDVVEGGSLARSLAENWPYPFENDDPLKVYHRRVELLNRYDIPNNCPIFEGEMLEIFLEFMCEGIKSLKELLDKPLDEYIMDQLGMMDRELLNSYAPLEMKLKNGKRLKVRYQQGKEPWTEIFMQDCYGLRETPTIMLGKHRLVLHLLGPSRRAAQVTDDLKGFWSGGYAEVRRELSRRYPKHYWPENPAGAVPVLLKKHLEAK